jgi:molybdopterin biosynthesis enzyme
MGALAMAQALVVVPPDVTRVGAGETVDVLDLLRSQV